MRIILMAIGVLVAIQALAGKRGEDDLSVLFGTKKNIVAEYPHRFDFIRLPGDMELCPSPNKGAKARVCSGTAIVPLKVLKPFKTIHLLHSHLTLPMGLKFPRSAPFITCSTHVRDKSLRDPNYEGTSKSKKGLDQFCAVVSIEGEIVFEFPIVQSIPALVAMPIGISEDGQKAAIVTGQRIQADSEDGAFYDIGSLKEVWVWNHPNRLTKFPVDRFKSKHWTELMGQFTEGKIP